MDAQLANPRLNVPSPAANTRRALENPYLWPRPWHARRTFCARQKRRLLAVWERMWTARAALQLAERIGATVDHMNGEALRRNTRVLQDTGWITTTLSEVKNRADLLLFVDVDVGTGFPRFFERVVSTRDAMFLPDPAAREIVILGGAFAKLDASRIGVLRFVGDRACAGKGEVLVRL